MKKTLFILLAIALFTSCRVTREECLAKYPDLTPAVTSWDTIWKTDSVVHYVRDTVIQIDIHDSIVEQIIKVPWYIPLHYTTDTSHLVSKWSESFAVYDQHGLFHRLVPKDTTIEFRLDSAIREVERYRELIQKSEKEKIYKESLSWWRKAANEVHGLLTGALITTVIALILLMKYGASFTNKK